MTLGEWIARHRAPREEPKDHGPIARKPTAHHSRCAVCGADLVDADSSAVCSIACAVIAIERQERAE